MNFIFISQLKWMKIESQDKGKDIPITGREGPCGMKMQGPTYTQPRHQEEVGCLVLSSTAFTPGKATRYSFYRRLSGSQVQFGHEGVKKNLHPSDPGLNSGRPDRSQTPGVKVRIRTLALCQLRTLAPTVKKFTF